MHKALVWLPAPHKMGVVAHTCIPSMGTHSSFLFDNVLQCGLDVPGTCIDSPALPPDTGMKGMALAMSG